MMFYWFLKYFLVMKKHYGQNNLELSQIFTTIDRFWLFLSYLITAVFLTQKWLHLSIIDAVILLVKTSKNKSIGDLIYREIALMLWRCTLCLEDSSEGFEGSAKYTTQWSIIHKIVRFQSSYKKTKSIGVLVYTEQRDSTEVLE